MVNSHVSIVLPTYNERDNVLLLISRVDAALNGNIKKFELIIVDDNSPDGTAAAIQKKYGTNKNIKVWVRKKTRGLATAILFGIDKASGEVIVGMDADLNHPPELIPRLVNKLNDADLAVASRFITGGGMEERSRYVFTYFFNLFLKYLLGFPTMDNMSGFYAINRKKLALLPLEKIYRGYGEYHLRLVYLAKKRGLVISQIPVYYKKRMYGESKSNLFKMFFNYLWVALRLRAGKI